MRGEIIHVDRYGNLVTNIEARQLIGFRLPPDSLRVAGKRVSRWGRCYAEGKKGSPMGLFDSGERVEIAVPFGSAARALGVSTGAAVLLEWQ